jgi:hypothetical protein
MAKKKQTNLTTRETQSKKTKNSHKPTNGKDSEKRNSKKLMNDFKEKELIDILK